MSVADAIARYRSEAGEASARKSGRNPVFPYVPVVIHANPLGAHLSPRQEQILGRAFIERDKAIACAQRIIDARVKWFETAIQKRGYRALREQYGLPRELVQ